MNIENYKRIRLSANFTLYEFLYSEVAINKGLVDKQIEIPEKYILNLKRLCVNVLQPLRNEFKTPIRIMSGYRCKELNDAVNGSDNSDHMQGLAADIIIPGKMQLAFSFIKNKCNFKQLIDESGLAWIHISYDEFNNVKQTIKLP